MESSTLQDDSSRPPGPIEAWFIQTKKYWVVAAQIIALLAVVVINARVLYTALEMAPVRERYLSAILLSLVLTSVQWQVLKFGTKLFAPEVPKCTDPDCACTWHEQKVFVDGRWTAQDCTNPSCTCIGRHHNEDFDTRNRRWFRY